MTPGQPKVILPNSWRQLRLLIQDQFNLEELRILCFDLGIDYEELGEGIGKSGRILSLIQHINQQERLPMLIDTLQAERRTLIGPEISLPLSPI